MAKLCHTEHQQTLADFVHIMTYKYRFKISNFLTTVRVAVTVDVGMRQLISQNFECVYQVAMNFF